MSHDTSTPSMGEGRPRKTLPRGACDVHAHVFGPYDRFPLAEPRPYTPAPAPKEDYLTMLDLAGFDRGVLVHGGANGWDHRAMLDAIASAPNRLRGIGVMPATASDAELVSLAGGGVRGLRFTEVAGPTASQSFAGRVGFDALHALAPKLRELGWHAVIWANADALAAASSELRHLELPLVVDHLGYFDVARGVNDPSFQSLVSLVREGDAWVKLTAFRNSKVASSLIDVRPFQDALMRANPERLLWGSDWPFLGMSANRPQVGGLLDIFDEWLDDDALREKILVKNPAALYGFE